MTESEPVASVSTLQKRSSANDEHDESSSQSVSASHIVTTSEVFSSELLWVAEAVKDPLMQAKMQFFLRCNTPSTVSENVSN